MEPKETRHQAKRDKEQERSGSLSILFTLLGVTGEVSPRYQRLGFNDNMTGNIIIKTTYDISLDFQDSLLPLGFLSLSRVRSSSFTLRSLHSRHRFL